MGASTDVLQELKFILGQFQAPLLAIYSATWTLVSVPANAADAKALGVLLDNLNMCTKIFYDLTFVDLPEYFEDNLRQVSEVWLMPRSALR